jgi:spoIIIJ-associated protein
VKDALTNILTLMHVEFTEIKTTAADERVKADISSPESSLLIGKGGQTLEAIEHVLNLIVNKDENTRVKVDLDTESYHRRQDERLESMAQKAADQVKRTGRLYRFDPMSSKDRRVIHLFLKNDPEVETFSEGEGQWRKVGVKPKEKK